MAPLDADDARDHAISAVMAVAIVVALAWLTGVSMSAEQIALAVSVVAALGILVRTSGNVTIGFVLVTIALLLWVVDLLVPASLAAAFDPITAVIEGFLGIRLADLPTTRILILTVFLVAVFLMLRFRFIQNVKGIDKITDRVNRQFVMYFQTYSQIARAFVLLAFGLALVFFQTTAQLAGEIGNVIAQVPLVVSNLFVAVLGYVALGGEFLGLENVPIVRDIGPLGWVVVVVVVLGLAAAAKYEGRGPLARYLER